MVVTAPRAGVSASSWIILKLSRFNTSFLFVFLFFTWAPSCCDSEEQISSNISAHISTVFSVSLKGPYCAFTSVQS
jgi:hypothetical protein